MSQQATLSDSMRRIPPVTRFFLISPVIVCLAISLNLVDVSQLVCNLSILQYSLNVGMQKVSTSRPIEKIVVIGSLILESGRFFMCFLLPLGILTRQPFQILVDLFFFYNFSNNLENISGKFHGNSPDYVWYFVITGFFMVSQSLIYNALVDPYHFPMHHQMMLSCITYTYSRHLKNSLINIWGFFTIKAYYLPLFNLFFKLISGYSAFIDSVIGISSGYLYQCIQSGTLPIYNLFHTNYPHILGVQGSGRRVGSIHSPGLANDSSLSPIWIEDSVFDLGHLKAPFWLYRLLNYPTNNTVRTTAFLRRIVPASQFRSATSSTHVSGTSSGYSWFGGSNNTAFKGKGYRLGS